MLKKIQYILIGIILSPSKRLKWVIKTGAFLIGLSILAILMIYWGNYTVDDIVSTFFDKEECKTTESVSNLNSEVLPHNLNSKEDAGYTSGYSWLTITMGGITIVLFLVAVYYRYKSGLD